MWSYHQDAQLIRVSKLSTPVTNSVEWNKIPIRNIENSPVQQIVIELRTALQPNERENRTNGNHQGGIFKSLLQYQGAEVINIAQVCWSPRGILKLEECQR